ncbi:DinB family protein [Nocardia suismassiliense]|uniref:DinB family protein n=1 Tax=Nocardia suismassiliense TaxID=2077092 RepID=UPI000D1DCECC|nr:DinB family protein [Nocardia suismassiliense]
MADQEREELISILADQRELFRITVRGIDDEQARKRTTASELTLGGLLHHLISCERHWTTVLTERDENAQLDVSRMAGEYLMAEGETVAGLLAEWDEVAAATAELIRTVDSLDTSVPTPTAPWSPEREWWTVRYTLLHIFREIAHHSGHADIIREELDGANTTYSRIS